MADIAYSPEKFFLDESEKFARKYPHHHQSFFNRPDVSRRKFFQVAGAGILGSYLLGTTARAQAADDTTAQAGVQVINKAKNTIFILLTGAIRCVDTVDLKGT